MVRPRATTAPTRTSAGAAARRVDGLRRRDPDWLQLLIHPEIWVYPGETMRETMLAFLDADREARLTHLANDRIDLT